MILGPRRMRHHLRVNRGRLHMGRPSWCAGVTIKSTCSRVTVSSTSAWRRSGRSTVGLPTKLLGRSLDQWRKGPERRLGIPIGARLSVAGVKAHGKRERGAGKRPSRKEERAEGLAYSGLPHIQVNSDPPSILLPFAQAS